MIIRGLKTTRTSEKKEDHLMVVLVFMNTAKNYSTQHINARTQQSILSSIR